MNSSGAFVARNAESRERLRAILSHLREADYARPIGHGWTVGAALAHLAHWDRTNLTRLLEWEAAGSLVPPATATIADSVNDEMLPTWLAMSPTQVAAEVTAAAEAVDAVAARLSPDLVSAILAVRARTIDRSVHRGEHLDEVERGLSEVPNG